MVRVKWLSLEQSLVTILGAFSQNKETFKLDLKAGHKQTQKYSTFCCDVRMLEQTDLILN